MHNAHLIPPWVSRASLGLAKVMLSGGDFRAEIMGLTSANNTEVFPKDLVKNITTADIDPLAAMQYGQTIYMACDPTSGVVSDLSFITFTYFNGVLCVSFM